MKYFFRLLSGFIFSGLSILCNLFETQMWNETVKKYSIFITNEMNMREVKRKNLLQNL